MELAAAVDTTRTDAILLSCAGTQAARAIGPIEAATGLPVVASNQALLWLVLRTLSLEQAVHGYGQLLESSEPVDSEGAHA